MEIQHGRIPLNEIGIDLFLTPEHLKIQRFISPDSSQVESYYSIAIDTGFQEPLKVWNKGGKFFLVHSYENYLALRKIHHQQPHHNIECLILPLNSLAAAKELTLRLRHLSLDEPKNTRLLNIRLLIEAKSSLTEIKRLYGVRKNKSESKQLERDYIVAKNKLLFKRVMGLETDWEDNDIITGQVVPNFGGATLSYNLAIELSKKLHADDDSIAHFDAWYEEYIRNLKLKRKYQDEDTKPVYSWKRYRRNDILEKASRIAEGSGFNSEDPLDIDFKNRSWGVEHDRSVKMLSIPANTVHYSHDEIQAMRKFVEILFHCDSLSRALKQLLTTTQFEKHGGDHPDKKPKVTFIPELQYKSLYFNNHSYFDLVWKYGVLQFCNHEHLLNSLGLRPHNFGFSSGSHDEKSSYEGAKSAFREWYERSFNETIDLEYSGIATNHRMYHVYASIGSYLDNPPTVDLTSRIKFHVFVNQLFSYVFQRMDAENRDSLDRVKFIIKSESKLRYSYLKLFMDKVRERALERQQLGETKAIDAIEEEILLSEGADRVIQELLLPEQVALSRSVSEMGKLNEQIVAVLTGMSDEH